MSKENEEQVWFDNPKILFDKDRVMEFWPSRNQTKEERINNTTRFILYGACMLYIFNRDRRIVVLAALVICAMYLMYKKKLIRDIPRTTLDESTHDASLLSPTCQLPTPNNPMANVLLSQYTSDPNRPPACYYPTVAPLVKDYLDETFATDELDVWGSRNVAARTFYSMPSTTIPNDQTAFAEACYGKKNAPFCKDGADFMCSPNARGVQQEVFGGLDGANQPRSGLHN